MSRWQRMRPETRRGLLRWARLAAGALILLVLVLRLGAAPFLDGVRRVDTASLVAALGLTAMTTVVSAWRWRLIARSLGLRIPLGRAVASYYRSQFLNSTLPGGVLGDVDRGVRHGEEAADLSGGLRSVLWDRAAGQVAQVVLATLTLLVLASPVRPAMSAIVAVSGAVLAVLGVMVLVLSRRGRSWPARVARAVRADLRAVLLIARTGPAILLASALVVAGHLGVFLVAARTAGSTASLAQLLPLAMLVLLSMTVPTSVAGWGPREGMAAWAFAAAGLGAGSGIVVATTYGILSLVATLPGAVVLLLAHRPQPATRTAAVRADVAIGGLVTVGAGPGTDG